MTQSPLEPAKIQPPKRRTRAVLLSVTLHASLLICLILLAKAIHTRSVVAPVSFERLALVETAGASHAIRISLPPAAFSAHTRHPEPDPAASKKTILPIEKPQPKMAGGGSPKDPHAGDGSGKAMNGNGADAEDARPAFPVFSPHPPVSDRSLLPASEQKIVVDVKLDELGQVVSETLVKSMGNKLDQIVLDIVRTWRFQPATVNGKPVPSEAELIFPFNQKYPITSS
jgi:TonB family protein